MSSPEADKTQALKLKEEGNTFFRTKKYADAEQFYTRAIDLDPTLRVLFLNRAMCRFHQKNFKGCEGDCTLAIISSKALNIKAYVWRAKAREQLGNALGALDDANVVFNTSRNDTFRGAAEELIRALRREAPAGAVW
eukprot:gnl/Chilomastix_cuspidata/3027.p1 GENE.gnl/Chilomastix_cuspidata/3027~~gnl/Chilomastix_cuspidata/3027.p1  ORF type:complete len:157 (+),score=68.80 gnl/Chilomastix_cuspidata/3027:63-473(+)